MKQRFYVSDLHLGHANICVFTREDGSKLRPWDDIDEHDEMLIKFWNETVNPDDTVVVVGDVVINRKHLHKVSRLNGRKILVLGNHDTCGITEYLKYFDDVRGYDVRPKEKFIASHIPIASEQFGRFSRNVHGHLHDKTLADKRYISVCVENTNYRPIEMSEMLKRASK